MFYLIKVIKCGFDLRTHAVWPALLELSPVLLLIMAATRLHASAAQIYVMSLPRAYLAKKLTQPLTIRGGPSCAPLVNGELHAGATPGTR